MESNSWRPAQGQGEPPSMEAPSADWRSQLQPDARQRIVNKIMDTLRRHLPVAVPEGMNELKKIALRFEDKIFSAAVNQSDYLRKISLKMLSMETKTQQNTSMNSQPGVGQNSADTGLLGGPPQVNNQGQPLSQIPMVSQPPARQQLLAQNLQNNTPATMQGSSASPSVAGLSQPTLPNYGHTSNMQNMPGISHSSLAQGAATDIYGNAQRQMQGRQQQQSILSQQQSQNPLLYQNQLQSQLMKSKMPNTHLQSMQQQQQQHSLLQANQIQPSQQSVMQIPSSLSSGQTSIQQSQVTSIQSAPQSSLQQNQLNSIQQSVSSLLPQHVQAIARQSQQPLSSINQQSSLQQQPAIIHQQSNLQTQQQQQQQQLLGQQANMSNIQQNQLLGQQNNIVDIKQQQQRLPVQQNNLVNMQQSQQLLNQQNLSLHQQQLGQQTNIQSLQQQQQPQSQQQQQQQQLISSLQNVSNMQPHQRSMQLLQQSKNMSQTQQQLQQPSMTLLQSQGQQTHLLSSQQQLMPQFQSQPGQLQQPLAMQQQPNSMQREMQQRLQISGALLQSQTAMEQQKPFMQSRGIPEVSSSTSIDSTAQTGHNVTDWQEEAYQKIQVMKEAYFVELHEFHQKISHKLQQPDTMPHAKQSESYEKLKSFKVMLDRMIAFLQVPKSSITLVMKEKLSLYEKQIVSMLSSNRRQKEAPSQQQGQQQFQHPMGLAQSTPQHHPSQVLQAQQQENPGNQVQQINMSGSLTTMQPAVSSSMQHGAMALSSLAAPATQQNVTNSVQSASDFDSVPVNSFGSLQQGSLGSVQQNGLGPLQNSVSTAQQTNLNNLSQSSMSALQPNNTLQNSNVLQQQHLKQQQQEHLMQNQQLKQQLQQRQIQQQLLQQQQRQQLLQPQQPQLHQQQKQHQSSQMSVHQMSQLHPMNELNELKARQGSSIKPGLYQQPYPVGQRQNLYHQQLKPGASFPISSPQNLQASSPQISHHSSPQIDQHALLPTLTKTGTPIQSTGSPFVDPSPSTPIAPSPLPGDSEKLASAAVSHPSAVQTTHQIATSVPPQTQAISVATPGISASPLLAEFTSQEGNLPNSTIMSRTSASERPLERLIKAVQSLSPNALRSAVSDIASVVSMIDRIAGSAPGNGSRAAVGEDLVAMTKCRLQARNFMSQDGGPAVKKMKRHTSAMPLNNVSSAGSINENFMKLINSDSSEMESTATSRVKQQKLEANHALKEEIREINQKLIDTVVSICDEDSDSVAALSEGVEGIIVKCSFTSVAFSPSFKATFASMPNMCPIAPLRLLVPANYPKSSPLPLDKLPLEPGKEIEELYFKAKSSFSISLRCLSQPMSLGEMAGKWDKCARKVIVEYAEQLGGGTFSSTYGTWENCVGA